MKARLEHAAISDKGLNPRKPVNEDSYLALPEHGLFVVADGVGGAHAGDVASQAAVQVIKQAFERGKKPADGVAFVSSLVQLANKAVHKLASQRGKVMGSTLALLLVDADQAVVAHVGDSRVYLKRGDKLLQLTNDHSKLESLLQNNPAAREQLAAFKDNHVITRALGMRPTVEPDLQSVHLKSADVFVLCTDGVHTYNSKSEILENLNKNSGDLERACVLFRDVCYARGAKDHLTAIVLKVKIADGDLMATRIVSPGKSSRQ